LSSPLFIGVGGHLVAIDPATGTERWRTKLKAGSFVTILAGEKRVFAGAGGELFCVDAASGQILWRNTLRGLGVGVVAFSSSGSELVQQEAAAAAAAAAV